jgi:hypothetical protein
MTVGILSALRPQVWCVVLIIAAVITKPQSRWSESMKCFMFLKSTKDALQSTVIFTTTWSPVSRNMLHYRNDEKYKVAVILTAGRDSDSLRTRRSEDRIPVRPIFSAPVHSGPGAHLASYRVGTGFLCRWGRVVALTTHSRLALGLKKE